MESLYTPRLRRAGVEIAPMEDSDPRQQDRALAQLGNTIRDSLTVSRANFFVAGAAGKKKARRLIHPNCFATTFNNDEDIANLIACLLHARSADAEFEIRVPPA